MQSKRDVLSTVDAWAKRSILYSTALTALFAVWLLLKDSYALAVPPIVFLATVAYFVCVMRGVTRVDSPWHALLAAQLLVFCLLATMWYAFDALLDLVILVFKGMHMAPSDASSPPVELDVPGGLGSGLFSKFFLGTASFGLSPVLLGQVLVVSLLGMISRQQDAKPTVSQ